MAAGVPRVAEEEARHEALRVYLWRRARLLEAGYDQYSAAAVAYREDVDLHRACALVRAGCSPQLACEILL